MPLKLAGLAVLCSIGAAVAGNDLPGSDHGAWFSPTMRCEGGSVEVTFGMDEAAQVSLLAFDAQGRAVATLIDRPQTAGYHHLSVFSNSLQGMDGRAYFQLRAGGRVLAEMRPRTASL
jgi:hypothetical protein